MPNWTSNRLTIEGPPDALGEFRESAKGTDDEGAQLDLLFSALLPEPDQSPLGPTPPGSPLEASEVARRGWHLWRDIRWGTNWEVNQVSLEESPGSLTYRFESAGNAPFAWLEEVSGRFPGLRFILEYQDEGTDEELEGIFLRCVFVDGEITEGDEKAIEDMRWKKVQRNYLPGIQDPWVFYFYSHPEEFVNAPDLMSGNPPEEIREWVEAMMIHEELLDDLREGAPDQTGRPADGDQEAD